MSNVSDCETFIAAVAKLHVQETRPPPGNKARDAERRWVPLEVFGWESHCQGGESGRQRRLGGGEGWPLRACK